MSHYLQLILIMLFSFGATANGYAQNKKTNIASNFDKVGWKVGIQSYTFTRYSLFDAIDAAADLGLKYVEATIWQTIEREKKNDSIHGKCQKRLNKKSRTNVWRRI